MLLTAMVAACGNNENAASQNDEAPTSRAGLIQDRFTVHFSNYDHQETLSRLLEALDRRDLTVFAVIDHKAGAEDVDLTLPPMTLVIFGNPRAGTPLMIAEPLTGAELPLRALVYDLEGQTQLALTGTDFLQRYFKLDDQSELLGKIGETLKTISKETTGG